MGRGDRASELQQPRIRRLEFRRDVERRRDDDGLLVARRIEASVVFKKSEMKSPNDCRLVRIVIVKDVAGGSPQYGGTLDETWFPCVNADF